MPQMTEQNGIQYTALCDPKFRSCLLDILFFVPHNAENAAVNALLPDLLTASSADYPSSAAMTVQLESLYAAELNAKLSLCGDAAVLEFTASWLDDRYALDSEPITEAMLRLLTGALLHPNAENGAFCEPEFRICKQNLLDDIDCELNDKRAYALRRGIALAFAGEPAAVPAHGDRASAAAITPAQAYAAWMEILQTAPVFAVSVTPEPKPQIAEMLSRLHRKCPAVYSLLHAPSPRKAQPLMQEETLPIGQTKLVLTYKYDSIPREILLLLCGILGWIQDSLLFMNLRERQCLCYYCVLQCADDKHALIIDSGIDEDDLETVKAMTEAQFEAMRSGDFTDDMIEKAILRYACQKAAASDTPYSAALEPVSRLFSGDNRSPQEMLDAMRAVTRQQLMDAAVQFRFDSGFILRSSREEIEPDES